LRENRVIHAAWKEGERDVSRNIKPSGVLIIRGYADVHRGGTDLLRGIDGSQAPKIARFASLTGAFRPSLMFFWRYPSATAVLQMSVR
jgi:hypothetical protein